MEIDLVDCGRGIHALDSGFLGVRMDAIHLIVDDGRAAFVDTGTNHSVPLMLAALERLQLAPGTVDYVILTHVHLDHAGGAGALLQQLPNAKLVVHPRGARHMIDPAKLWAGTVAVYGETRARADYGELVPVDAARVIEAADGSELMLGTRRLVFHDAPGHAKHHLFLHDTAANAILSGDTFGLSYPGLAANGREGIFPTTTPTQFEPDALRDSVARMMALQPDAIYLTHYSQVRDVQRLGQDMQRLVGEHEQLALRVEADGDQGEAREAALLRGVQAIVETEAARQGADAARWSTILANDVALNAQGLSAWLDFRARAAGSP